MEKTLRWKNTQIKVHQSSLQNLLSMSLFTKNLLLYSYSSNKLSATCDTRLFLHTNSDLWFINTVFCTYWHFYHCSLQLKSSETTHITVNLGQHQKTLSTIPNYPLFSCSKSCLSLKWQGYLQNWCILTRTWTVTWAVSLLCLRGSGRASLATSVILTAILYWETASLSRELNNFIIPKTKQGKVVT